MKTRPIIAALAGLGVWACVVSMIGCDSASDFTSQPEEFTVRTTCSGCHLSPDPPLLPRSVWTAQIERMAILADYVPAASGTPDFDVEGFVDWYESRAPEQLPMEQPITSNAPGPIRFERRSIRLGRASGPGVASVGRVAGGLAAEPQRFIEYPLHPAGAHCRLPTVTLKQIVDSFVGLAAGFPVGVGLQYGRLGSSEFNCNIT